MSILNFQTMAELRVEALLAKILLYGDSGAGKTHAAATAPKPCFLLLEPNGLLSIRSSNPDAIVIDVVSTAQAKGVPRMEVVREFFRACYDGTIKATGTQTIVIDSMTELQRLMRDEIASSKRAGPNGDVQWGLPDWQVLTDRMRKMLSTVRDLPFHVVAIALSDTKMDAEDQRYVVPCFQGQKLANEAAQYFGVVGYVFKRHEQNDDTTTLEHRVLLNGPSNYLTKTIAPLDAVEQPNIASWIERVLTHDAEIKSAPKTETAADPKQQKTTRRSRRSTRANAQ